MKDAIHFTVYGTPRPQGSMKSFKPNWGACPKCKTAIHGSPVRCHVCGKFLGAITTSDNAKLKSWRQELTRCAVEVAGKTTLPFIAREFPVALRLDFYLARPQSLQKRIVRPIKKPDVDKLVRGVLDSLTGSIFVDDSQVVQLMVGKWFGQPERVEISVMTIEHAAMATNVDSYSLFESPKGAA
jgi:Holliday junction resolvase RusA-like endonuclease